MPAEPDRDTGSLLGRRVGMVTHYMPPHIGGIELLADALGRAYAGAGAQVRWVASRAPASAPRRENGRIRVACWNGLERALGVPWPVWAPAGVVEIARLARWADVLHVHDCLYFGSALGVVLARRAGKPVVLSQHVGFVRFRAAALNAIERLAYRTLGRAVLRRASRLVFCTPAAEEFVGALLGSAPPTGFRIPYGIDTDRFRPPTPLERLEARRGLGFAASDRVVLFVGRLVEKKGANLYMEVTRRHPSVRFLMVGDGPLRPASAAGADNLKWLPFVPPTEMVKAYHAADVFLLPSHGEGFPLAIIEAMAAGVPVIASRGEAFTRVLEGEGACLAAERTPDALAQALERLWKTPGQAAALANRARGLAVRELSLRTMEVRYVELVRTLGGRG